MGQGNALDVSHESMDRSQLNFAVPDDDDENEAKDEFDFDTSGDEGESIKFEYDIQTNSVEELRNIIKKLQNDKDAMEHRLRNRVQKYRERIISLERELKQMNNNVKRFTKDKIKKLEGQKKDLEEKIKTLSKEENTNPLRRSNPLSDVKKLSLRQKAIEGEIRKSRMRSIHSTRSRSKRGQIIKEFFFTEKSYVDCLVILKNEYLRPLSQNKSIMSPKVYDSMVIFKCFDTIFRVNHQFLSRLEETVFLQERDEALVQLVIEFCDSFKLYSEYIKRFAQCQKIFNDQLRRNKKLVKFLDETAQGLKEKVVKTEDEEDLPKGGKDVNMSGLLITPIQRLPRYLLLLKDLLKYTRKNSRQYSKLEEVIKKLQSTINYCNEKSKEYENTLKLIELSKKLDITLIQKSLVLEQKVHRVNKSKRFRPCLLYLFNDILVVHQLKGNILLHSFKGGLRSLGKGKKGGSGRIRKTNFGEATKPGSKKQWNIYFLDHRGETHGGLISLSKIRRRKDSINRKLPPRPPQKSSRPISPLRKATLSNSPLSSSLPNTHPRQKKPLPASPRSKRSGSDISVVTKASGSINSVLNDSKNNKSRSRSNSTASDTSEADEENRLIEQRLTLIARVNGYQSEMRIVWNNVKELNEFVKQINLLRRDKRLPEFRFR